MSSLSSATLIQQLDDEILTQRRTTSKLSRRRNTLLPACRLPPEILALIFQLYITSVHGALSRTTEAQAPFEWIAGVTHTCQYWREVALSTPMLWTFVTVAHCRPELIEAFVQRSKAAPLVVDAAVGLKHMPDALSARLSLLHRVFDRIERLRVELPCALYGDLFPQIPASTPSSLLQLFLGLPGMDEDIREQSRFPLVENVLVPPHTISSLQHLDAYNYAVKWDSCGFPTTLTSLSIDTLIFAPMTRVVKIISNL
ncbi:hypothetical protein EIP91_006452, partial [Steccherinum ochraceum]